MARLPSTPSVRLDNGQHALLPPREHALGRGWCAASTPRVAPQLQVRGPALTQAAFCDVFDQLGTAAGIYSIAGVELARNRLLERLVACEPEPCEFLPQIRQIVRQLSTVAAPVGPASATCGAPRTIRTQVHSYTTRAAFFAAGMLARDRTVCVTVQRAEPQLPAIADLRARFGLTLREAQIALMLARGGSNKRIAECLGIRPSTVRTHSEHIFPKLGVTSRKALALTLLDDNASVMR